MGTLSAYNHCPLNGDASILDVSILPLPQLLDIFPPIGAVTAWRIFLHTLFLDESFLDTIIRWDRAHWFIRIHTDSSSK